MSIQSCINQILAKAKEEGRTVNTAKLDEQAAVLDKMQREGSSKAEIQAKLQELFQKTEPAKAQAMKLGRIQTLEAVVNADKATSERVGGKSIPTQIKDYIVGGGRYASDSSNVDPRIVSQTLAAPLYNMLKRMTVDFGARLESDIGMKPVWQELDSLQRGGASVSGDSEAFGIAQAIHTIQEKLFRMKQAVNPALQRAGEFLIHRTFDADKILTAGRKAFVADMEQNFGLKSIPNATDGQRQFVWNDMYDRIQSGIYGTSADKSMLPTQTMQNMAMSRELQANSWEHAWAHNEKYGSGNTLVTLNNFIRRGTEDVAQMQKFSGDVESFKKQLLDMSQQRWTDAEKAEYQNSTKSQIETAFKQVAGVTNSPANGSASRLAKGLMTATYMAHAGTAMLSHIPDIAMSAGLMQGVRGTSVVGNFASLATSWIKYMSSTSSRMQALETFGVFSHTMNRDLLDNIGGTPQNPGVLYKMASTFGKMTLVERATDSLKAAIGEAMHNHIGQMADTAHADLSGQTHNFLLRYGIKAPEWDHIRGLVSDRDTGGADGMQYKALDAEMIHSMPDEKVDAYMRSKGVEGEISPEARERARYSLSTKYMTMVNDMASIGAARPGSAQMRFMYQGTDINTPLGVAARLFWQFKGAAMTTFDNSQRILKSGAVTDGKLQSNLPTYLGTGALAMGMWVMKEMAKDAMMGKTPEDPLHPRYALRAVMGSGFGGILGDAFANDYRQNNAPAGAGDLAKNFLGPVVSTGFEAAQLGVHALEAADPSNPMKAVDVAHEAVKLGGSMLPGQNIFWAKPIIHLGLLNAAKEMTHSGYLRNLERSVEKTPGIFGEHQEYFNDMFKPTTAGNWMKDAVR